MLGDAVKEEEVKEGMGAEEHEHEHGEEEHGHEEEAEYDEHVWLSLKNAAVLTGAIRDALTELDAEMRKVTPPMLLPISKSLTLWMHATRRRWMRQR